MVEIAFVYVGIGGFLGSCLRYLFTLAFKHTGIAFPVGTLVSNVLAGLLIGFIIGMDRQTSLIPPQMKLFLTTGILGGLSTFSTFSLETVELFSAQKYLMCAANVCSNLFLSLLGVAAGMLAAKWVFH